MGLDEVIKIRVWADSAEIEDLTDLVIGRLKDAGLTLVERSVPYICQPPKQHESRVYLKFTPAEWLG